MDVIRSEELAKPNVKKHPFLIKSMTDEVSQKLEPTNRLIGQLIYPEEQTILFGKTGVGKSVLAIQVAEAISEGKSLNLGNGVYLENDCDPIAVIYFDFELSQRQFQNRYDPLHNFKNLFIARVERGEMLDIDPKKIFTQIKSGAEQVRAKCIIIDNISAISGDLEKGENAKHFMQELWKLARDEKYTIIILAHTTKVEEFKPITVNHLAGSSKINQLCDSIIAIGEANRETGEYYIIQLKNRNTGKIYDRSNVIHTRIAKEGTSLRHHAIGLVAEADLLVNVSVDLGRSGNRLLCVYAYLYYGSGREASKALAGMDGTSHNNITTHVNAYKASDSKSYNKLREMGDDQLMELLESQNPSENCLPKKKIMLKQMKYRSKYYWTLEPYNGRNRFRCPGCDKSRTYTRFIDSQGNYAPYEFGKCDRQINCGYFRYPSQIFTNSKPIVRVEKPQEFIDWEDYNFDLDPNSDFIKYLLRLFKPKYEIETKDKVFEILKKYHVRTDGNFMVFPQINRRNQICTVKKQEYRDGHRTRNLYTPFKANTGKFKGCLFGYHLFDYYRNIRVVESAKTAIMATLYFDDSNYIFMSTEGVNNFRMVSVLPVSSRVKLMPDKGKAFEYWKDRLPDYDLDQIIENCKILKEGDDLGDWIEIQLLK